jgi:chemotaxis protein CheZ
MALQRKLYRIEQMGSDSAAAPVPQTPVDSPPAVADGDAGQRHDELMAEIKALRALVGRDDKAQSLIETYRTQIGEFRKITDELLVIHDAINRTKQEIATVHISGFQSEESSRVKHELDAVVTGTEQATQTILGMVEDIDQLASTLIETAKDEAEREVGRAIQERVVHVFEACNFQDITGQRISKVVSTWKFIESHVARMMEIWGGVDAFKNFVPEATRSRESDDTQLLNGPKLEGDEGHVSQDDIDALFK